MSDGRKVQAEMSLQGESYVGPARLPQDLARFANQILALIGERESAVEDAVGNVMSEHLFLFREGGGWTVQIRLGDFNEHKQAIAFPKAALLYAAGVLVHLRGIAAIKGAASCGG